MLIHVKDANTLQGARTLHHPFIIPYGIHQEYELQIVSGIGNQPVDIESRGCVKWTLTVTPSAETPTKVLAYAVFPENIATGSVIRFDLAATSVEMYKQVAGNPATPAVLQLLGFTSDDEPPAVKIVFPVALTTTAQTRLPVDLSTALMQEIQLATAVTGAAERVTASNAIKAQSAAEAAEQAASDAAQHAADLVDEIVGSKVQSAVSAASAAEQYASDVSSYASVATDAASTALAQAAIVDDKASQAFQHEVGASSAMRRAVEAEQTVSGYTADVSSAMEHTDEAMSLASEYKDSAHDDMARASQAEQHASLSEQHASSSEELASQYKDSANSDKNLANSYMSSASHAEEQASQAETHASQSEQLASQHQNSVAAMSRNVSTMSANVGVMSDNASVMSSNMEVMSSDTLSRAGEVSAMSAAVSVASSNVVKMSSGVTTMSGSVAVMSSNVAALEGSVVTMSQAVSVASSNVAKMSSNVATASTNVMAASSNVATMSGNVTGMHGEVVTMSGAVSMMSSNIGVMSRAVSSNTGTVSSMSNAVGLMSSAASQAEIHASSYADEAAADSSDVAAMSGNIVNMSSNVGVMSAGVSATSKGVDLVSASVASMSAGVSNISKGADSVASDISAVQADISNMSEATSSNMDIAVDKANSASAAASAADEDRAVVSSMHGDIMTASSDVASASAYVSQQVIVVSAQASSAVAAQQGATSQANLASSQAQLASSQAGLASGYADAASSAAQEVSDKMDKDVDGVDGNVAMIDSVGNAVDAGFPVSDIVRADGLYPDMTVGRALNLLDPDAPATSRVFGLDTACGDISISDDGTANPILAKGTTYIQNQLVGQTETVVDKGQGAISNDYAVAGNIRHAYVHGSVLMKNQLIPDDVPKTAQGPSPLDVTDSTQGNASSLVMTAPPSVVQNQLAPSTQVNTASGEGSAETQNAVAGNAVALKMTAPRSVVMNQLARDVTTDYWERYDVHYGTITFADGELEYTVTQANPSAQQGYYTLCYIKQAYRPTLVAGHVYRYCYEIYPSRSGRASGGPSWGDNGSNVTAGQWNTVSASITATAGNLAQQNRFYVGMYGDGVQVGDTYKVRNCMLIDLTLYAGGDSTLVINTLNSWANLQAYDPSFLSHVPYNTGTVTGVAPSVTVIPHEAVPAYKARPRNVFVNQLRTTNTDVTATGDNRNFYALPASVITPSVLVVGHTYLVRCDYIGTVSSDHEYLHVYLQERSTGGGNYGHSTGGSARVENGVSKFMAWTITATSDTFGLRLGVTIPGNTGILTSDNSVTFSNIMVIDLTQYFNGDQEMIDSVTSWDDFIAYDSAYAQYVSYNAGTEKHLDPYGGSTLASPELFTVGAFADTHDAVAGLTTNACYKIIVTGNEAWRIALDAYIKSDACDALLDNNTMLSQDTLTCDGICSHFVLSHAKSIWQVNGYPDMFTINNNQIHLNIVNSKLGITDYTQETRETALAKFKAYLQAQYANGTPVTLVLPYTTPTTVNTITNTVSLAQDVNCAIQTDSGRTASVALDYTSTDVDVELSSSRTYICIIDGVSSRVTDGTTQHVTGGQDMVVDLTRYFSGNATSIAAIQTWDDLAAFDSVYASYVQYNAGVVKGVRPSVTVLPRASVSKAMATPRDVTMNQKLHAFNSTYWSGWSNGGETSNATLDASANSFTATVNVAGNGQGVYVKADGKFNVVLGHVYLMSFQVKGPSGMAIAMNMPISGESMQIIGTCSGTSTWVTKSDIRTSVKGGDNGPIFSNAVYQNTKTGAYSVRNAMIVDLTEYFGGDQELISSIATISDLAAYDSAFATYAVYDAGTTKHIDPYSGTTYACPQDLFSVPTVTDVADSYDVVSGVISRNVKTLDLGDRTWVDYRDVDSSHPYGYTFCYAPDKTPGLVNVVCAEYTTRDGQINKSIRGISTENRVYITDDALLGMTAAQVKAALSGVVIYYESTTTEEVPSSPAAVPLPVGDVSAIQTDDGLAVKSLALGYDGTSFTFQPEATHTYICSIGGQSVRITDGTAQQVTGGVDMAVDLSVLLNKAAMQIAKIQSWTDMVALVPAFGTHVAYDTGTPLEATNTTIKAQSRNLFDSSLLASVGNFTVNGNQITVAEGYSKSTGKTLSQLCPALRINDLLTVHCTEIINGASTGTQSAAGDIRVGYNNSGTMEWTIILGGVGTTGVPGSYSRTRTVRITQHMLDGVVHFYSNSYPITFEDLQFELGSTATDYVPYYDGGSAACARLLGIPGSAYDRFDPCTGRTEHRIGTYTFTGNENWTKTSDGAYFINALITDSYRIPSSYQPCWMLQGYDAYNQSGSTVVDMSIALNTPYLTANQISIYDSTCENSTAMAAKLAGRTLYYRLATPTTDTDTEQPLTQPAGHMSLIQSAGSITQQLDVHHAVSEWDISVPYNHKVLHRATDGTESIVTGGNNVSIHVVGGQSKVINLMTWFGTSVMDTMTVDKFYSMFPTWRYADIPVDYGTPLQYKGTGVQTIGFNAYNHATGTARLLGGNKYQICGTYTGVSYTDMWGHSETLELDDAGIFTPANTGILTVTGGNGTDTCVHLCWSGYKNYGEPGYKWEPYAEHGVAWDFSEQFPNGMGALGSYQDTITKDEAKVMTGLIEKDGSESWSIYTNANIWRGVYTSLDTSWQRPAHASMFNRSHSLNNSGNATLAVWVGNSGSASLLYLCWSPSTTDDILGFLRRCYDMENDQISIYDVKEFFSEHPWRVVHGLVDNAYDRSRTIPLDGTLNMSYQVNDFGTEESLPVNTVELLSADFSADVQYSIDFTRTVQHYSEIESSVKDLVEEKDQLARVNGYYAKQGLGAKTAENLVDPNAPGVVRKFSVDTSCGTASISDNGNGVVELMKGSLIRWNQLTQNGDAHNGTTGWFYSGTNCIITAYPDDHVISMRYPSTMSYYIAGLGCGWSAANLTRPEHMLYITFWICTDAPGGLELGIGSAMFTSTAYDAINVNSSLKANIPEGMKWTRVAIIRRITTISSGIGYQLYTSNYASRKPGSTVCYRDMQMFDLTEMFGFNKEPKTIAEFEDMFPEPFYAYDAGTMVNYKGTGIKTVGFNQFSTANPYIRVRPQAYQITGTYTGLNYSEWPLRTQPVALTAGQPTEMLKLYSVGGKWYSSRLPIAEYDATASYKAGDVVSKDGAWYTASLDIEAEAWTTDHWTAAGTAPLSDERYFLDHSVTPDADGVFAPSNYGWLYVSGGNDTDTCVHFTWSGYRNGDYEPYWENTKELPVATYFPDGMDGVLSDNNTIAPVGDELYADKYVKRIVKHEFTGTEAFTISSGAYVSGGNYRFDWKTPSPARDNTRGTCYDIVCNMMTVGNVNSQTAAAIKFGGNVQWVSVTNTNMLIVPPNSWGTIDTEAKFRAKLKELYDAGTPLTVWYVRKTPVVTEIQNPQQTIYPVADFGTEVSMPPAPQSMPMDAIVKYSTDYTRELTHLIDENVRGRVDQLEADVANKADKNGDYRKEGLIANAAGNLIDEHADPVVAQFTFRTTAGNESVAAQGVAEMQSAQGNTGVYRQYVEDYHENTLDVYGGGHIADAKGGSPVRNVFQGETIVSNQLVPASVPATVTGNGLAVMPYATADGVSSLKVQGLTLAKNQLIENGNFADDTTGWTLFRPSYSTMSVQSNVATLTATSTSTLGLVQPQFPIQNGHQYLATFSVKRVAWTQTAMNQKVYIGFWSSNDSNGTSVGAITVEDIPTDAFVQQSGVLTGSSDYTRMMFICGGAAAMTADDSIAVKDIMIVDLTLLFNGDTTLVDNITTWDDLVALMPVFKNYQAKDTGTLVPASGTITTGVWNQRIYNGNFAESGGWSNYSASAADVDLSVASGKMTITVDGEHRATIGRNINVMANLTHVYYLMLRGKASVAGQQIRVQVGAHEPVYNLTTTEATYASLMTPPGVASLVHSYIYLRTTAGSAAAACTYEISAIMFIDLTLLFGLGNEPATVEDAQARCLALGYDITQYQAYDAGTPMGGTASYAGLNSLTTTWDEWDLVSGVKTIGIKQYTMTGDETYMAASDRYIKPDACDAYVVFDDQKSKNYQSGTCASNKFPMVRAGIWGTEGYPNTVTVNNQQIHFNIANSLLGITDYTQETTSTIAAKVKAYMKAQYDAGDPVVVYYELATPVTTQETAQPLTTVLGENVAYDTQYAINGVTLEATYDTTRFSIPLDAAATYYTKLSGTESIQTGIDTLAVDSTQDKVMDLTFAYLQDMPATVEALKKRYPGVVSLGAYDAGSFVHTTGGVWTTGVWNQKIGDGEFTSISSTGKGADITRELADGVITCTLNVQTPNTGNMNSSRALFVYTTITRSHKYLCCMDIKASEGLSFIGMTNNANMTYQITDPSSNWTTYRYIATAGQNSTYAYYISFGSAAAIGASFQVKNCMCIDLTLLYGAGNEPSTVDEVEAYCASIGHDLSQYQTYNVGTALGGTVDLTDITLKQASSTVKDTFNAETGEYKVTTAATDHIDGSYSFGSYTSGTWRGFWTTHYMPVRSERGAYITTSRQFPPHNGDASSTKLSIWFGVGPSTNMYIVWDVDHPSSYATVPESWLTNGDPSQPNVDGFNAWIAENPFYAIYKVYTPTETTLARQPVTLLPGLNPFYQSTVGTLASHDKLDYMGTQWTIPLGAGKFLFRHNGEYSVLTLSGLTQQAVQSGDKLVFLSSLFGTQALVPATLDEIFSLYPQLRGDLPYDEGTLVNFMGTALKTVGFNQWDGTFSETGKYLDINGNAHASSTGNNITNFIRIVGGLEYEVSRCYAQVGGICWYDIDKNFISGAVYNTDSVVARQFVAPANACWAKFTVRGVDASSCVFHLCWSGYRNYGTDGYAYEPYKESIRELHVQDWFPYGLAKDTASGRYDELTHTKAIKRIRRYVVTGNESWGGPSTGSGSRYFSLAYGQIGSNDRLTGAESAAYVKCNLVPTSSSASSTYTQSTGCCYFNSTGNGASFILFLPYKYYPTITTATQLKRFLKDRYEAGNPVIIQWPLATPVETDISDELPQLQYPYEDFGTEEIIPANGPIPYTTPADLRIVYQKDFTREIANLPENYISKDSLADLNAQLGQALGGTISGAYSDAQGKFVFTFTKNPTVATLTASTGANSLVVGMTYIHAPTVDAVYTLPTPSDLTQDNTIIIDVTCSNHTITFKQGTTTLAPQQTVTPASGVKYRFICTYAFSAWKVFALEVT